VRGVDRTLFQFAGAVIFVSGVEMEAEELEKVYGEYFYPPVAGRLSSGFGWRADPFDGAKPAFHNGIDLAAESGSAVRAGKYGRVVKVGADKVFGNYIKIGHKGGYESFYGHLESIEVKEGDKVMTGDRIGTVGDTGLSTGSHLHFSIEREGSAIDPLSLIVD
jgi:murein DD-endopeptidase MepM/ murein hydrolase activator NlpD